MRKLCVAFTCIVCFAAVAAAASANHKEVIARWKLPNGKVPAEAKWSNPVNRNLIRLAKCETGGINGGKPLWSHYNSTYWGALGFWRGSGYGTWEQYRHYVKPATHTQAHKASPAQQLAVGRALVKIYGYSPWPACSRRLGLR